MSILDLELLRLRFYPQQPSTEASHFERIVSNQHKGNQWCGMIFHPPFSRLRAFMTGILPTMALHTKHVTLSGLVFDQHKGNQWSVMIFHPRIYSIANIAPMWIKFVLKPKVGGGMKIKVAEEVIKLIWFCSCERVCDRIVISLLRFKSNILSKSNLKLNHKYQDYG